MRFRYLFFLFVFLSPFHLLIAQTESGVYFSGTVKSKETGEAVPRASIGILGSSRGTIANVDGRFSIVIEKGKAYKLRIRAIGFKPDTISVALDSSQERNI